MLPFRLFLLQAIVAAALAATTTAVFAQLPPHTPGAICATQRFWCWTQPYGVYGQPCASPTAGGNVPGTYV